MRSRKPQMKLDEDGLMGYAVRSLADHASSSEELRTKLRRRAANLADIEKVISRLMELNYLDDRRFAEMYTAVRLGNDGFGKARILQDLRLKRVPGEFAEEAIARAFEDKNEDEMVGDYIRRRMPSVAAGDHKGDDRKIAAAYRKLRRAGFSTNSILTVLRKYAAHPEMLDEPPPEDELPDV